MLLPAIQLLTSLTITTLILATLMISLEYCNNLSNLLNDLISSSLTFPPTNMEYNQVIGCKTYYSLAFICLFLSFLLPLFSFYTLTLLALATLTFLLFLKYSKFSSSEFACDIPFAQKYIASDLVWLEASCYSDLCWNVTSLIFPDHSRIPLPYFIFS